MLYIKWTLIYLVIPIFYLILISFGIFISPPYNQLMFLIPVVLTIALFVGLIISTVKQEKQNVK